MPENPQNSTSDELAPLLATLTRNQLRFVVAMQECATKKEAAEAIGIEPNTARKWGKPVDDAIRLMAADRLHAARALGQQAVIKAMAVKIAGLDSDDESTRQKAATELIEWHLGKATQPVTVDLIKIYEGIDPDAV